MTQDKYEKIGQPDGSTADDLSSTPIGSATVPAEAARLAYYPMGGGEPPVPPVVAASSWNAADVAMSANTFNFAGKTVNSIGGSTGRGSVRSTPSKTGKRYVEIVVDNYGTSANLGLAFGFWKDGAPLVATWNTNTNRNFTWTADGSRSSLGQTNSDTSFSGAGLAWPFVNGDVFQLAIDVATGVTNVAVNGGIYRTSVAAPFTDTPVDVFACMGDGNFGQIGSGFQLTLKTTAATQSFAAPSGYTPWDD